MGEEQEKSARVGWRHEWGTLAMLWAMVLWLVVTIATGPFTFADLIVILCVLAGAVVGTLLIVDASQIPMRVTPAAGTDAATGDTSTGDEAASDAEAEDEKST